MAPRPEPTITAEEARTFAGKVRPAKVTIEVLQALLKDGPQWHSDKRIWFWADTEGKILYSVNENRVHGEGDMSLKMPAEQADSSFTRFHNQETKTMWSPDVVVEDPETGKLSLDPGEPQTEPEQEDEDPSKV